MKVCGCFLNSVWVGIHNTKKEKIQSQPLPECKTNPLVMHNNKGIFYKYEIFVLFFISEGQSVCLNCGYRSGTEKAIVCVFVCESD